VRNTSARLVVQVEAGPSKQLYLLPDKTILYEEICDIRGWDVISSNGKPLISIVRSTARTPNDVYPVHDGHLVCLSQHGKAVADLALAKAEPVSYTAADGARVTGIQTTAKNYEKPMPWQTIVLLHRGPYSRVACGFDIPLFNWTPWLVVAGYAILNVNYRGSSFQDEDFAAGMKDAGRGQRL
jgi:dipeptidyl aminopeptidase/acylaminoacyl peptidase